MTITIKYLILFFLAIIFLIGCSKRYEEDPWTMKFVSIKKRIVGEWHINKILIGGVDSTSIIYADSLKTFSYYKFNMADNTKGERSPTFFIKTENASEYLKYPANYHTTINTNYPNTEIPFDYIFVDKNNKMVFGISYPDSFSVFVQMGLIRPYGPINTFESEGKLTGAYWDILELTKKEMHLSVMDNSKKYELFFKKISK